MTDFGLGLRRDYPDLTIRTLARIAEELGYHSLWINHPPNQDGFGPLAQAARVTSRIRLGTGAVPVSVHTPSDIVQKVAAAGLPTGRYRLGIGSGSAPQPLQRVRAAIGGLRRLADYPLVLAALGPRMCALAGELADGVLLNAMTPTYAAVSRDITHQAAAAAGRPLPRVVAYVAVAVGDAGGAMLDQAADFYLRIPAYVAHFQRMGVAPSEAMLRARSAEEVAQRLAGWRGVVDEVVIGPMLPRRQPEDAQPILEAARP